MSLPDYPPFAHPLGGPFSIPPSGGNFPQPLEGLPGIPTDGGWNTVDQSGHAGRADSVNDFMFAAGPSSRNVYDPLPTGVRALSTWPGGTSALLGNAFYDNLLSRWLTNETISLRVRLNEILKALDDVKVFLPEARRVGDQDAEQPVEEALRQRNRAVPARSEEPERRRYRRRMAELRRRRDLAGRADFDRSDLLGWLLAVVDKTAYGLSGTTRPEIPRPFQSPAGITKMKGTSSRREPRTTRD